MGRRLTTTITSAVLAVAHSAVTSCIWFSKMFLPGLLRLRRRLRHRYHHHHRCSYLHRVHCPLLRLLQVLNQHLMRRRPLQLPRVLSRHLMRP